MPIRESWLVWMVAIALAALIRPSMAFGDNGMACSDHVVTVAITDLGLPTAQIHGELCRPGGSTPDAVQLLVHGGTYNGAYWDWPYRNEYYSFVRAAVARGYATFNVDRLGNGQSSRPLSLLVDMNTGSTALHNVIGKLRQGAMGGIAFEDVVWVGHSLGSLHGWLVGSRYPADVDAFLLTGILHGIKLSTYIASPTGSQPAFLSPQYSSLDPGYLVATPEARVSQFFYTPNAEPEVIELDAQLADTTTATELLQALALGAVGVLPATSPSRAIRVPTRIVVAEHDAIFCGQPDGVTQCGDKAAVTAHEAPYYRPDAQLTVQIDLGSGHDNNLHTTGAEHPAWFGPALDWVETVSPL